MSMNNIIANSSPHIHCHASTRRVMLDVIIALLPACVAAGVIFGVQALIVLLACVASAVVAEALFNLVVRKKQTIGDLSAVVTGVLLGLNLSTNVPVWQCCIGSAFAIIVVKGLFGGLGRNFANPAITARVFMLVAFSAVAGGANPTIVELTSSATPLEQLAGGIEAAPSLMDMFLGLHGGTIGETCIAALLVGFVYLLVRKVIKWHIPVVFIGTVFVCYLVATGDFSMALYQILAGGLFLGAIFMATDYVTCPITLKGRVVFAVGCGLITFAIRHYFRYPEGVSFSILAMNILTPAIEKITANRPLGGSGLPVKGRFAKPAAALVCILLAGALVLTGINCFTAPVIEANLAAQQFELLFTVMPEAEGFDTLYDAANAAESTLVDVPETVAGIFSETSGKGYALRLSTTKGFTGEAIEAILAIDAAGKVSALNVTSYPETKDFGADYPSTYIGADSTMSTVELVAGCTYSSAALKNAVSDGFAALIANGLVVEAVKSDDQILEEMLMQVYPGIANASGILQYEEQTIAEGQFTYIQRALKALNEDGFAFYTKDGEKNFLAICNMRGGLKIFDTTGTELSGDPAFAAMAEEVRTYTDDNVKVPKKPEKKLRKLVSDEAEFTALPLNHVFNSVTSVYECIDGGVKYYGFTAKPYAYNNLPMEVFYILDESGAIVGMNVDEIIFFPEYFTDYVLEEDSYKAGFTGLTADTFTGEQALITGATFSADGIATATEDVFEVFRMIQENGGDNI